MIGPVDDALAKIDAATAHMLASAQVLARVQAFMKDIAGLPGVKVEFRCEGEASTQFIDIAIEVAPVKALAAPPVADETDAESHAGAAAAAAPDARGCEPPVMDPASGADQNDAASTENREVASKSSKMPAPWTAEEEDRAVEMKLDGATNKDIASDLGRTVGAVGFRLVQLRKEGRLSKADPQKSSPKAVSAPPPAMAEGVPPPSPPAPAFGETNDPLRRVHLHLNDCADVGWTDSEDLQLIEGLSKGCKLDEVAALLRKNPVDVRARFLRLCPEPSIEVQAKLIKVLLQRVRSEA